MKIVDGNVIAETEEEKTALRAVIDEEKAGVLRKNAELIVKLKELKNLEGVELNEYQTLKQQAADAEANRLKKSGEFDTLKEQLVKAHQKEIETRTQREKLLTSSLEQHLIDAEATRSITDAKGSSLLLLPHVKSRVRVEEEGGRYVTKVIDPATGSPRMKSDGAFFGIADLVAEMKADVATFGRAFEPSGAAGSGATGSNGGGGSGAITRATFDALSPQQRHATVLKGTTITD